VGVKIFFYFVVCGYTEAPTAAPSTVPPTSNVSIILFHVVDLIYNLSDYSTETR